MNFTVEELIVPAEITPDWVAQVDLRNDVIAEFVGNRDLSREPEELLPRWQNPLEVKHGVLARVDGEIVGRGVYETESDASAAWVSVEVLPEFRGHGIGSALHEQLVAWAREEGKTSIQKYATEAFSDTTDVIPSPTGFGAVPRDTASSAFLLKHGYVLEQVGRMSRLDLPVDVTAQLQQARDAAGPDFTVLTYTGRTPEHLLEDMAQLRQSMGTDAPSAGMDTASIWTAERVRADDDAYELSPSTMVVAMVHHAPSGEVAGYTELDVPPETERAVAQGNTIVMKAHRGHRLGMLLKVANIAALDEFAPGHPAITTSNAVDNVHMLAVNEAVGFTPWATMGAWKTEL
ncbi:GNAT family N-acetyltransferase [Glaciihabitans arcticus]|uniref:GNAT family N-acetyltransferase n=1 Tax=Glaciihabitans arcticus TaxID=2668039 RepID=A0A4Q9GN03_9MICO|nr:GNAT family N-acetyltransferase [Glaciihabitans arcticus]TBN56015.1 GNAT family N-acetyltransferase [Glaciihabitans arcticus]